MILSGYQIIKFLKNKEIILSSILFTIGIFFWDLKINQISQSKFLILPLLGFFFLNFNKNEGLKFLSINFLLIFFIFLHSIYFVNFQIENYFLFSIIFLFLINCIAYDLSKNFEIILEKSCFFFILICNFLIFFDLIFSDYYLYDHNNQYNGLCRIFNTDANTLLNVFFIENSHFGMTSNAIVVFQLLNFSKLSNFYKINFILYLFLSTLLIGSLTLYLGLILSIFFILPFLYKKNAKGLIFLFIIQILIIINFNNCNLRITQIFQSSKLFQNNENIIKKLNSFIDIDDYLKNKNKKIPFDKEGNIIDGINVSTVVFLSHISFVSDNFKNYMFGIGFQNYETFALKYAKKNDLIKGYETQAFININDGASNLNKFIAEFGLLNILFGILFLYCLFKSEYSFSVKCFVFTNVITQLLRGAGYFNGGFIFIIIILLSSVLSKKLNNTSSTV
jgi:hypothetical protein